MHSGILSSFRSRLWRRVVAPSVVLTLAAGLCPLPVQAEVAPRLTVAVPSAEGEPGVADAVLASVHRAVRQVLVDSPSFAVTDADALAKETVSAQANASLAGDAVRLAAARLGAELLLQLHVLRTRTGDDGVTDLVAKYRLIDVIAGEVVSQGESVGVSGAAEPETGTKLDRAAQGLARQVCERLEQGTGVSVGLGAPEEHGLVPVSSTPPGVLRLHSWLMVFRGERHVAALEVVQADSVSTKACVRYLKGIPALEATDRVRFVFSGGLASTPAPAPANKQETSTGASPPPPGPRKHRRNRSWQKLLGILALVGIVALVSNNSGGSSSSSGGAAGTGNWQIDSTPSGAALTLDGRPTGRTTPTTFTGLTAGSHTITLTLNGYNALTLTKTIAGGQTLVTSAGEATLTPGGSPPSGPPAPQP